MPGTQAVRVLDTSGGCGSMYRIEIVAEEFK
jgi:stress-induced morphogen